MDHRIGRLLDAGRRGRSTVDCADRSQVKKGESCESSTDVLDLGYIRLDHSPIFV